MPSFVLQGLSRLGIAGAALVGATTAVLLTKGVHTTMRLLLAGVVLGAASSMVLLLTPEIM